MKFKIVVLLFLFPATGSGQNIPENSFTQLLAIERGWQSEVKMPDETRCDLVSDEYAVEVEWAYKWKEAPAQAILYSIWLKKTPRIILLVKELREEKLDILRCKLVCERLEIELEVIPISRFKTLPRRDHFQNPTAEERESLRSLPMGDYFRNPTAEELEALEPDGFPLLIGPS